MFMTRFLAKYHVLVLLISCQQVTGMEVTVRGSSMSPCFTHGSKVEVRAFNPTKETLKHNDVVVFKYKTKDLLKRVVALESDKFELKKNDQCYNLYINSKIQFNSAKKEYCFSGAMLKVFAESYKNTVPKNHFIALGDQVQGSEDSSLYGLFEVKAIQSIVPIVSCYNHKA